jgi:hypothetical protein
MKTKDVYGTEDLHHRTGQPPVSGYESWARQKIEAALTKKQNGQARYKPLREIAAKYEPDAS